MNKVAVFLLLALFVKVVYSSDIDNNRTESIINRYSKITSKELFETGSSFARCNMNDSAMICFSLIYNRRIDDKNKEEQQIVCKALNKAAAIYIYHCNYKMSLELLLRALEICESIDYKEYIGRIYNNIGNMYARLSDYESARKYFKLAYNNSFDNDVLSATLNNLGTLAHKKKKLDSALLLYKQTCAIKKDLEELLYNAAPLNNIALIFQDMKEYDSAFLYYRKGLSVALKLGINENEAKILSNIGKLHVEMGNSDSAKYYLKLSCDVAEKSKLLVILSDNYLTLSKIQEKSGRGEDAFTYYKLYSSLKDSILDKSEYGTLNEVQFMYDMGKLDKQIKELNAEQEMREKTIAMQRRFQFVMGLVLLIVISFVVVLYLKNKTLNGAYSVLVSKNLEIIKSDKLNYRAKLDYQAKLKDSEQVIEDLREELMTLKSVSDNDAEAVRSVGRAQNVGISDDARRELELAILEIMNNREVFCDPNFSLTKLSDMVGSNFNYVSYIINSSFNSNFKTFIHEYRIKEACRLFADPKCRKYSIETIANMVGFKSKGSFNPIFKEITGVTPSFYIRSLK